MNEPDPFLLTQWRDWASPMLLDVPGQGQQVVGPQDFALVEIMREGWLGSKVVEPQSCHYAKGGLYWRPWPIIHPRFDGP